MRGIIKYIKEVLTYKPSEIHKFELLEGSDEGVERENTPEAANIKVDSTAGQENKIRQHKDKKLPLSVEEWNRQKNEDTGPVTQDQNGKVSSDLNTNMEVIKKEFGIPYNTDIMTREFKIAKKVNAFIAYIDGMVDRAFISDFIIRQLMDTQNFQEYFESDDSGSLVEYIENNVISVHEIGMVKDFNVICFGILSGDTVLFIDGSDFGLMISTRGFEKRSVEKPVTENVVMGSHEGFTENLRTNLTLVRKIIKNKNLITEMLKVGKTNQAYVGIMYLNGIVNQELVKEVKRRLVSIDADYIAGDGMVEQFIEDNPLMIFPQALSTERPDRVASFLMDGKVAIIPEGTPFAEIVPITIFNLMQTSEDAMLRWQYGTFLRLIRVIGMSISVFLPALYVALTLFHQEMIPTELLAAIAGAKEEVPFPTLAEIVMLELAFELIREGGIRIPGIIGQTLGIIGALILGQAAVAAGLVSPVLIIIVAVTGLGSFTIPNYPLGLGLRILRFIFIFFAAILGFYGISLALFLTAGIACSMKSFGVPFLSPVAPKTKPSHDLLVRQPIWRQKNRPDYMNVPNRKKQKENGRGWQKKRGDGNT